MKVLAPITNSSNFYSVVWFSESLRTLPINEAAYVGYSLFGAVGDTIIIETDESFSHLDLFYERKASWTKAPRLIRSFPDCPKPSIVNVERGSNMSIYTTAPGALAYLSSFPWTVGDGIGGVADNGSEEKWWARLIDVSVRAGIDVEFNGRMVAIIASNHWECDWESFIDKVARLVPSPDGLVDIAKYWQENRGGEYVFYRDVLLIENFCLWSVRDDVVCGISLFVRQDEFEIDERRVGYGARLIKEYKAERKGLQVGGVLI